MTTGTTMADGRHPLRFMFDEAALRGVPAIPVTCMDRYLPYQAAVRDIVRIGGCGVALRCRLDEMLDSDFATRAGAFLTQLGTSIRDTDLILDLGAPSFDAIDDLAELVAGLVAGPGLVTEARSRTVLATSFPESLAGFTGVRRVKRNEWLLFKAILAKLADDATPPAFGDYAISSTRFPQGDMRKLTVMANVRYTSDDEWLVGRGKEIRVHGRSQFRGICDAIRNSDGFLPAGFSPGSQYLVACADGGSTGGSSTWNWVGINHHITKVVHDLAILSEP
ncbi:MAG: hypothetical protein JWL96_1696 [Sphingomonas bacterium]|nr:hypothetical protein [Sphingomonas bacterium]